MRRRVGFPHLVERVTQVDVAQGAVAHDVVVGFWAARREGLGSCCELEVGEMWPRSCW